MAAGFEETREPNAQGIVAEGRRRRNGRWLVLACVLLVALGAMLRARELADRPLWIDEASFWKSSRVPLIDKLAWRHHYEHPPLAYIIEGWTFQRFGDRPEWVVRLPSFLFGLSCIPLALLLGRMVGGDTMGLLAATLATVDPVMVEQSRQARMYSQFEALLLVTLMAAIALARRRVASRLAWTGLGALEASLYWTSQAGLAAWLGQLLGMLWLRRSRLPSSSSSLGATHWRWTWGTALVLSGPGLYRLAHRLLHPIMNREDATDAVHLAADMATTIAGAFGRLGVLLLPLSVVGLVWLCREKPIAGRVLTAIAGANLVGLLVLRTLHPLLKSRYLVALFPSIWIGAAAFVVLGPFPPRVRQALFALALVGLVAGDLRATRSDAFLVAEEIRALPSALRPGDAVVYLPRFNEMIGQYYGVPRWPPLPPHAGTPEATELDGHRVWLVSGTLPADRYVRETRELIAALARRRGVDAATQLAEVTQGYTGVMRFEKSGHVGDLRLQGQRLVPDP